MLLLNILFMLLNLHWSREHFDQGRAGWGWFCLVASAWCASAVLLDIL
jgi:hypothetical protein